MRLNKLKKMMTAGVAAVALTKLGTPAFAQTTVKSTLTTSSAITVTDGVDAEYGSWMVIIRTAETITLTMSTATCAVVSAGATNSTVVNLSAAGVQCGTVLVKVPTGANNIALQMQRTAITDFPDVGVTLTSTTYATATEGQNQALPATTNKTVTAVTGGTNETVTFGGVISITATPADAANAVASYDVSFSY